MAIALVDVLMAETIKRRFDRAFGISRSEDDWDQRLAAGIIAQLEMTYQLPLRKPILP